VVKTPANPGGLPLEVFDGIAANSSPPVARQSISISPAGRVFTAFNRVGAKVSQGVIQNWWRQAMMGSAKAHYDGIKAFSETDIHGRS